MSKYQSVTLMEGFRDAAAEMDDAELAAFTRAVLDFGFDGIEPEGLDRCVMMAFRGIQATIRRGQERRDSGGKGGGSSKELKGVENSLKLNQTASSYSENPKELEGVENSFAEQNRTESEENLKQKGTEQRGTEHAGAQARASVPAKKQPQKSFYGEFKNVALTDEQFEELMKKYPYDYMDRIEAVSAYCEQYGKKYKNYYAAIRNWARHDEERAVEKAHDKITSINKRAAELKAQDDILEAWARGESNPDSRDFWEVTT